MPVPWVCAWICQDDYWMDNTHYTVLMPGVLAVLLVIKTALHPPPYNRDKIV